MVNSPHPEEIKALLRIRYGSLQQFEAQHRLPACSATAACRRPHRRAEIAIAKALGIRPEHIWPSRYSKNGHRLSPQPRENYASARGAK
jgi:Ner family transcriptional regulator